MCTLLLATQNMIVFISEKHSKNPDITNSIPLNKNELILANASAKIMLSMCTIHPLMYG